MILANFEQGMDRVFTASVHQWDYGQQLRITGLNLPPVSEVHFCVESDTTTITAVGVTTADHTDVDIPDGLLQQTERIKAYVYVADPEQGKTIRTVIIPVNARQKPQIPHSPEDAKLFRDAIQAVNESANRSAESEKQAKRWAVGEPTIAGSDIDNAKYYSQQAKADATKTDADKKAVEELVKQTDNIAQQVEAVKQNAMNASASEQNAKTSETNAKASETNSKISEDNAKTSETNASKSAQTASTAEQNVAGLVAGFGNEVLEAVTAIDSKKSGALKAVMDAGTTQTNAINKAGTDNVNLVTTEGTKQLDAVKKEAAGIVADRQQIQKNATDVTTLKEDLNGLSAQLKDIDVREYSGYFNEKGNVIEDASNYNATRFTDFIYVLPNTVVKMNQDFGKAVENWVAVALYDENANFIRREVLVSHTMMSTWEYLYTIPQNVKFIRVTYRSFGKKMKMSHDSKIIDYNNELSKEILKFNSSISAVGFDIVGYLASDCNVVPTAEHGAKTSAYISVKKSEKYTFLSAIPTGNPHWMAICEYNENTKSIQRLVNTEITYRNLGGKDYGIMEYTVPANCHFIRISTRTFGSDLRFIGKADSNIILSIKELLRMMDEQKDKKNKIINPNINVANHRGYNTTAPENTLSAFKLSKKMGFDIVETDVSFTSDGVPVLLHDNTVDRTSNGTGAINTLTLAQVKALDFGSWKDAKYAGEKIPTFEEFLLLCKRIGLKAYVEIKDSATELQVKQLVNLVRKYGMNKAVTWASFVHSTLIHVKNNDDKARLGYVTNDITQNTIDNAKLLKTQYNEVFIDADHNKLTEQTVELCINSKFPLEVWTVNSASALNTINPYASGITTDSILVNEVLYNENIN